MWLVLALSAFAQDPDSDVDTDTEVLDASNCGLRVTREVLPTIETALPAGSLGCEVRMTVDERGRVANVEPLNCPEDVVTDIRPTLDRWRFERTDCPVDDPLSFDTTFETDSQTWLIPPTEPVPVEVFVPPPGTEGCLMAATLLPDGWLEHIRASDESCAVSLGGSGWNPERFWKAEIEGLRCRATFDARNGHANNVVFEGCGGPSRLALVSFVERAAWSQQSDEAVPYDVRFRMRDDGSAPLERASQEARYIRDTCENPQSPGSLTRRTQIPAMPARWSLDQSELAAYCRLRIHLTETGEPRRIDAVLCSGVYGPRAASAASQWNYQSPTCNDEPIPSEVVVLVPFAKRTRDGVVNVFGRGTQVVDLVGGMLTQPSQLEHCEMWIDVPSNGKVRITTSDRDQCYVTPTSVPSIPRRQLIKWADLTEEWNIRCDSTFTAETVRTGNADIGACYMGTRELVQEPIRDWSWSVLGREKETYTVHWRFRLD